MSPKKKIKKELSILFIISRAEKMGHKDIDHVLPFLYFLMKNRDIKLNVKLLIFGDENRYKKDTDPRIKFLLNLRNIEIIFLNNNIILSKIKNILTFPDKSGINFFFNRIVNNFFLKFAETQKENLILNDKITKIFIKSKNLFVVTTSIAKKRIPMLIKKINKSSKWMVIPHGTTILANRMVTDKDLNIKENLKPNKYINKIDYILNTSKEDQNKMLDYGIPRSKQHIIGSPRYCKDWLKLKSKFKLDGQNVPLKKKYKAKILFLVPKKFININSEELIRSFDFISSYQEIEMIILKNSISYPKISSVIKKRSNVRLYYVGVEYSTTKLIEWADIVIHAGTGVIFESFMKEKITVLPRYLSSNTFISENYNAGWNLKNRDELRDLCNAAIISISNLKKTYKKETQQFNSKFINDFVYGNLDSVPKK